MRGIGGFAGPWDGAYVRRWLESCVIVAWRFESWNFDINLYYLLFVRGSKGLPHYIMRKR